MSKKANNNKRKMREAFSKMRKQGKINMPNGDWTGASTSKHGTMAQNSCSGAAHRLIYC